VRNIRDLIVREMTVKFGKVTMNQVRWKVVQATQPREYLIRETLGRVVESHVKNHVTHHRNY